MDVDSVSIRKWKLAMLVMALIVAVPSVSAACEVASSLLSSFSIEKEDRPVFDDFLAQVPSSLLF